MNVQKLAAFSDGDTGGNPAGVVIGRELPSPNEMQAVAKDLGFSETAFAAPNGDGFRVRYFAPEMEVPFCGHATIALGAALAVEHGDGEFDLNIASCRISVSGHASDGVMRATLSSPPTSHAPADSRVVNDALTLFGLESTDLESDVVLISGGAEHLLLPLVSRNVLADMSYEQKTGKDFMDALGLITVMLVQRESDSLFNVRNAFAAGGVYEDPATGAAAAAFAGYLRDSGRWNGEDLRLVQGEDMAARSILEVRPSANRGGSVNVSGAVRRIG